MDSSTPDNGFTLTIKGRDATNQITVQNSEDLQTARVLLDYHVRQALEHETSSDESEPAEIDIHPHVDINSTDTDQLKNSIEQLQAEVEDTISADEINSFQDTFSQELEKLRNRVNQLETDEPNDKEKWGLDKVETSDSDEDHRTNDSDTTFECSDCGKEFETAVKTRKTHHDCNSDDENEEQDTKILTPDGDDETYDTVEEAVKPDQEPGQDNALTLEQFRQHSGNERTNKIFEVIKEHAPITRVETGEHLFGHEISTTDTEYKELYNYWPDRLVEVAGTDGQANVYQPKHADKPEEDSQPEEEDSEEEDSTNEEPKHTSKCSECGTEFHGDRDEVDDKLDQHYEQEHQEDEECDCPTNQNGRKTHNESCPKVRALAEDNNEEQEQEDELDLPELETSDYTKAEFNDLTVNQRSEVIIRTLLQHQPCTLNTVSNQIFQPDTEPPKDKIRHFLENYWQEIIVHEDSEDGKYSVVPGVQYDPDTASLSALANVWRTGQYWSCEDCDKTYESRADAKTHRQNHGHLNWGFTTGGALVDKWRQNSNEQRKAGEQAA